MSIVSINVDKLKKLAEPIINRSVDSYNDEIEVCRKKMIDMLQPLFGNIISYRTAAEIYAAKSLFYAIMSPEFVFYENRMFLILALDEQFIFEVDTDKNHYKDLESYKFNYMHLRRNHINTGISEYNDYSLGYRYDVYKNWRDDEYFDVSVLTFILFKDNIAYIIGNFQNDNMMQDFISDRPNDIDKVELAQLMKSIILLNEMKT